jgi:hypothetical protein
MMMIPLNLMERRKALTLTDQLLPNLRRENRRKLYICDDPQEKASVLD